MSSPTPDGPPGGNDGGAATWYCYRHPDVESGVRCRRCERPICPECMVSAPVGFQCPRCVKAGPEVRSLRSLRVDPHATYTLMALNVIAFLPLLAGGAGIGTGGRSPLLTDGALWGPAVDAGEWWRLVTSGFLHFGLMHLAFNVFALYLLGGMVEPALGRLRFVTLYATALLGGSFGALLLSPHALTAGASGAVFGLMGAAIAGMRKRGVNPMESGVVGLLVINLLITFGVPGISIGGHLGGLAAGAAAGFVLFATEDGAGRRALGIVVCLAMAVALVAGALATAG
jgi:membrane associated rhomboid family serine protease